jgi:hypothetical protein
MTAPSHGDLVSGPVERHQQEVRLVSERVVLARKGASMVRVRWTEACPEGLYRVEEAEELGARWEGDELVTYDLDGFVELYKYYESNEYLPDND